MGWRRQKLTRRSDPCFPRTNGSFPVHRGSCKQLLGRRWFSGKEGKEGKKRGGRDELSVLSSLSWRDSWAKEQVRTTIQVTARVAEKRRAEERRFSERKGRREESMGGEGDERSEGGDEPNRSGFFRRLVRKQESETSMRSADGGSLRERDKRKGQRSVGDPKSGRKKEITRERKVNERDATRSRTRNANDSATEKNRNGIVSVQG